MIWNVFFLIYFLMKFVQSTAILIRGATFGGVGGAGSGGRGLTTMAHSHARRRCALFPSSAGRTSGNRKRPLVQQQNAAVK